MINKDLLPDTFFVKISPSKSKNNIVGLQNGILLVEINAKPVNGEANKELLQFLKKTYKKNYQIINGKRSRIKKISIKK